MVIICIHYWFNYDIKKVILCLCNSFAQGFAGLVILVSTSLQCMCSYQVSCGYLDEIVRSIMNEATDYIY